VQINKTDRNDARGIAQMRRASQRGPARFDDIANLASTTALSLKVLLRSNHKQMPNLILSDAEADDVIAFILSRKQK
jgi:hypothetical protein